MGQAKGTAKAPGKKKRSSKHASKGGKKVGKVAPKYKNPADGVTWSGRGRKPKWIEAHLAKHGNLDKVAL